MNFSFFIFVFLVLPISLSRSLIIVEELLLLCGSTHTHLHTLHMLLYVLHVFFLCPSSCFTTESFIHVHSEGNTTTGFTHWLFKGNRHFQGSQSGKLSLLLLKFRKYMVTTKSVTIGSSRECICIENSVTRKTQGFLCPWVCYEYFSHFFSMLMRLSWISTNNNNHNSLHTQRMT